MTQVDELTARLDITGLAEFVRGMAQADASVDALRKQLRGLTEDALAARAALAGLGVDARSVAEAGAFTAEIKRTRDAAVEANAAAKDIGVSDAAIAKEAALNDEVKKTRDLYVEAAVAARSIGGRSIPFGSGNLVGSSFGARDFGAIRDAGMFGLSGGTLTRSDVLARDAESQARRDLASGGLLGLLFGAQEAKRLAEDSGGRGGGGGGGGFFAGLLPGGRRANAAAVTAGIGLLAGAAPAILPSALALAPIAGAGAGTLIGAAGTLKLAFADLTAAAFTNRNAFLALTPVQQQFVQTLRSLDAGLLVKNLEPLAQQTLLPQLTAALHAAFTPAAVSSLQGGVSGFANALGGGAQQLGSLFGSTQFQAQFGTMLQQDAGYLRQFFDVFTKLTDGFVRFQVAAGPFLTWVGQVSQGFANWADNAIRADAVNGRLAHFFDIVKTSLQTVGNLLLSVGHLAGALFDAIGFQNSVGLVNLLASAINTLAGLLHANAKVLSDFFGGAVASARDLLTAIQGIVGVIKPVLSALDSLIGGAQGFRGAIDTLAVFFVGRFLLMKLAVVGLIPMLRGLVAAIPELAIITAITLIITHWRQLAAAMPYLWRVAWDGIKGILDEAVYGILYWFDRILLGAKKAFDWVPIIGGELSKTYDAFNSWVSSFSAAGQQEFHNAGALAGQAWSAAFTNAVTTAAGKNGEVTLAQSAVLRAHFFAAHNAAAQLNPQDFQILLTPPPALLTQYNAAMDAHGNLAAATKGIRAYYDTLLKQPGLSLAQKNAIYQAESAYPSIGSPIKGPPLPAFGTPGPMQQTGGGSAGFATPTTAGGAVFTAQQALQQAMTSGSGVSFGRQVQLAKAFEAAAAAAYAHLKNQAVVAKDVAAKQAELTTLAKDEATARRDITTILERQAHANVSAAQNAIAAARAAFTQAGQSGTYAEQLQAAKAYMGVLTDQLRIVNEAIAKRRDLNAALREQRAILTDIGKLQTDEQNIRLGGKIANVLGLGATAPLRGPEAAARTTSELRTSLNAWLKQFGLAQTGSAPLGPFVTELYKLGDVNKRQYESLEKILTAIGLMKKDTGTVSSAITGNVSQRLAGIKQELSSQTGFTLTGAQHSLRAIIHAAGAHLVGTPAAVARALEQGQYAQAHHGTVLTNAGAALGVPLTRTGAPSLSHVHVTVEVKGNTPLDRANARIIAAEVAAQLRRKNLRNSVQMTGANAGVNMGI